MASADAKFVSNAHKSALNVVQCSGSMMHLAKIMKEKYRVPHMKVSYFGIEDMSSPAKLKSPRMFMLFTGTSPVPVPISVAKASHATL